MFNASFFIDNRDRLAGVLPGHVVFISAHAPVQYSADVAFPFRQDSNFWYLTGVSEPDAVLVLEADTGNSTLLTRVQSEYHKEWDGENKEADFRRASGIANFDTLENLEKYIKKAVKKKKSVGYLKPSAQVVEPYGFHSNPARRLLEKALQDHVDTLVDVRMSLARLRSVKHPIEIAVIQKAIDITADTLVDAKGRLAEYATEKEVENAITAGFYSRQAQGHAYEPIVACGGNAATLHYTHNSAAISRNSLLLLDVGAQVDGYCADITRTWAAGAQSTQRQKELHAAVLSIQQEAFAALKPGVMLREYQKNIEQIAFTEFKKLGISLDRYPHGFSHFLGMDVHDAGDYNRPLQENMVLTVEPGVYLQDEGIGIRIEDDVLITKDGIRNLSASIPAQL